MEEAMRSILLPRRSFLRGSAALAVGAPFILRNRAALAATSDTALPGLPYGIMAGDVGTDSAVIWSRSDRPARMIVECATSDSFANAHRVVGPAAMEDTDFTARVNLCDLPADEHIFYRVSFEDLADLKTSTDRSPDTSGRRRRRRATSTSSGAAIRRGRAGASISIGAA